MATGSPILMVSHSSFDFFLSGTISSFSLSINYLSPPALPSFSLALYLIASHLPLPLLRTLYPELKEQLKELRKHLVESTNEMAPLKVWQMQGGLAGLGMKVSGWGQFGAVQHPTSPV